MRPTPVMSPPERLQALERLGEPGQWAVEQLLPLTVEIVRLQRELAAARAQIRQPEKPLEEWQRQAHRPAAPFRRPEQERSARPGRPGRQAGHAGFYRPKPEPVDERIRVNRECRPHGQGPVSQKQPLPQYIEEIRWCVRA
jgi:hypothetical protein